MLENSKEGIGGLFGVQRDQRLCGGQNDRRMLIGADQLAGERRHGPFQSRQSLATRQGDRLCRGDLRLDIRSIQSLDPQPRRAARKDMFDLGVGKRRVPVHLDIDGRSLLGGYRRADRQHEQSAQERAERCGIDGSYPHASHYSGRYN